MVERGQVPRTLPKSSMCNRDENWKPCAVANGRSQIDRSASCSRVLACGISHTIPGSISRKLDNQAHFSHVFWFVDHELQNATVTRQQGADDFRAKPGFFMAVMPYGIVWDRIAHFRTDRHEITDHRLFNGPGSFDRDPFSKFTTSLGQPFQFRQQQRFTPVRTTSGAEQSATRHESSSSEKAVPSGFHEV